MAERTHSFYDPLVPPTTEPKRSYHQFCGLAAALAVTLDAADEALVDSLVTPGHPSTPGYNDPAYPLEGR